MSISAAAHFIVILVLISAYHASQVSQALLRSGERKYEVIYFSGTKLKHVQPIRVARGTKVASSTADGELKLPRSDKAVANLLAIRPVEPPAPVQALRSMLSALGWKPEAVPPAPIINVPPTGSVTIPSFATSGNAPTPGHSANQSPRRHPAVTVVGTSRSGGALNHYGALPGSRVYTVYIDTKGGTAVLEYSAVDPSGREFSQDLVAPEAVSAEVPVEVRSASFVVSCVMDRSGLLRNVRVLRNSAPLAATQLVAVLQDWRFRPVLRGRCRHRGTHHSRFQGGHALAG